VIQDDLGHNGPLTAISLDTSSSILESSLTSAKQRIDQGNPAKRQKLEANTTDESIASKVQAGRYTALAQLEEDVSDVCAHQLASIKKKDAQETGTTKRLAVEDVKVMQKIMTFELAARDIFARARPHEKKAQKSDKDIIIKEEVSNPAINNAKAAGRTVLSLFGNAPTPRQLFSSLQSSTGPEIPLEELGLPNMLSASKLLPITNGSIPGETKVSTFGDVFAPPASIAPLQPPKASKHTSNRSGSISFVQGTALPRGSRKSAYPSQSLTVGDWLSYGMSERSRDPSSSSSKRRSKDRSYSVNERPKPQADDSAVDPIVQEDSLFKAAFSSFAPTYDNAKALIPHESRNMVWWNKSGAHRYDTHFAIDLASDGDSAIIDEDHTDVPSVRDEAAMFEEAIKSFDEEAISVDVEDDILPHEELLAGELLGQIADLLQSLASYQRIRSSQISTSGRVPPSPAPVNGKLGSTGEPSSSEIETYRSLRSRLAELVARVPPHAVAKMDGDQLEDLRVSQKILMQNEPYNGVLEEDQFAKQARSAAAASAAALANLTSRSNATSQAYGQYGRSGSTSGASRPSYAPQTVYGGSKTPAAGLGRTSSSQNLNTPSNGTSRQSYNQMGAYTAPVSRVAGQQNYGQNVPPVHQYHQRSVINQQYTQGSPQPQAQRLGNYSTSQQVYQGRSQNATPSASVSTNTNTYNNTISPAKPAYSIPNYPHSQANATATNGHQQASGRNTPSDPLPEVNGFTPNTLSAGSAEQQKAMFERQRAQMAAQSQARMAAQVDASRQDGSTSQANGGAPGL